MSSLYLHSLIDYRYHPNSAILSKQHEHMHKSWVILLYPSGVEQRFNVQEFIEYIFTVKEFSVSSFPPITSKDLTVLCPVCWTHMLCNTQTGPITLLDCYISMFDY